jgi:hypothetical protein
MPKTTYIHKTYILDINKFKTFCHVCCYLLISTFILCTFILGYSYLFIIYLFFLMKIIILVKCVGLLNVFKLKKK